MRGDGSIQQVKDKDGNARKGVWRVSVSLGENQVTGKRRRVTRIVHGSKEDAKQARDALLASNANGLVVESDGVTFGQFVATWLQRRKASGELSERSMTESEYFAMYFEKSIGHIPLRNFNAYTVESVYQAIKDEKRRPDGSTISNRTLRKYHVYLKMILGKAVAYDLIPSNPCDKAKPPKAETVHRRSLSDSEASRLAETLAAHILASLEQPELQSSFNRYSRLTGAQIGLATGIRLGEMAGLTWRNIDLKTGRLYVCQARTKGGNTKAPKSEAGFRWISFDPDTRQKLEAWKAHQAAWLAAHGITATLDTPIVCNHQGTWQSLSTFGKWWEAWREDNGFPGLKFHELRHTQATLLLANGVDPKTVQARLGHSSITLTMDVYAHAVEERDTEAANIIGGIFDRKQPVLRVVKSA